MKARYIVIIFLINYLILLFTSSVMELWYINSKAKHIKSVVQTAADMALEQVQVTDDFFVSGGGYHVDSGINEFKIRIPKGEVYEEVGLFEGIYGLTSKENIFLETFGGDDFKAFARGLGDIRVPIMFWNGSRTGLEWYSMARIVQVGIDITGEYGSIYNLKHLSTGDDADFSVTSELYNAYKINSAKRTAYEGDPDNELDYFVTPISIGVTYINPKFLGMLFVNNMDLLMRSKYAKEGISLLSEEGGDGVYKGFNYASLGSWDEINDFNPINDGIFTLVRGPSTDVSGGYNVFEGITPEIEYRVIDMYDSVNDDILTMIFGAKSEIDGVYYSSKSEYFKASDMANGQNTNPLDGVLFDTKPIVVAKVTFRADIIIPYVTVYSRFFRGKLDGINQLDLKRESGSSTWSGNRSFNYTRYFAVAY